MFTRFRIEAGSRIGYPANVSNLPDVSLAIFERIFPRTSLALGAADGALLAHELGSAGELSRFPAALAARKWEPGRGFVPDLAELEYRLRLAALAPEIESRGFERIAAATEPDWFSARLRFDPGHCLFECDWPLEAAYANPQDSHARRPSTFLIYRGAGKAQFRPLGENEAALLKPLSLGVPLGKVLERRHGPDFDAPLFGAWIETGLLRAIDWAGV